MSHNYQSNNQNNNGNWIEIGYINKSGNSADKFGQSVSLSDDGTTVAIGAKKNNGGGDDAGYVFIYKKQFGNWTQLGQDIIGESGNIDIQIVQNTAFEYCIWTEYCISPERVCE